MSTRRGLQIVCALIALLILAAILDAYAQDGLRCEHGACTIPVSMLRELIQQATRAEDYAAMCGWTKP